MPTLPTIVLFIITAQALLIIPGPAVLYIVARSVDGGRRGGLVSALGIGVGSLFHVAAATLGLSAFLLSSATAFSIVKYAGAAYLIYLGVRTLLERGAEHQVAPIPRGLGRIFSQGVLVNLLNPKTALFFYAFLPQFVDPGRGAVTGQILFFGGLFVLQSICSDSLYALLAGSLSAWLQRNRHFLRVQRYCSGAIYLLLGTTTALTGAEQR